MRWPLKYQIMLPMAAAMLGTITCLSGLQAFLAGRQTIELIEKQISGITQTVVESRFPLTQPVLQQMQGLSGATFVLLDASGGGISSSESIAPSALASLTTKSSAEVDFLETRQIQGRTYFHAMMPLPDRNSATQPQVLHILYSETAYRAAWRQAAQVPLLTGAAALAVVAFIAIATASRVSHPLSQLQRQMGRIASGNFAPITLPDRDDEVRDLGQAVNRMAEMLVKYEDEVRRAEQSRTLIHLVRGIAHQLRNSATGAQMALDIHRQECSQSGQSESLAVADRQLMLIEKYLQKFLAVDARAPRTSTRVEFCELIEGLVPLLQPTAKHVAVELEVATPTTPLFVTGDADALEHVVLNLLLNAIQAAERGTEQAARVQATVSSTASGRLRLTVEDTGNGPAAEIATRVFEPFATDKVHGTGLGLSLAKDIAEAHNGTLGWERYQNVTRFCFEIPLASEEPECAESASR